MMNKEEERIDASVTCWGIFSNIYKIPIRLFKDDDEEEEEK